MAYGLISGLDSGSHLLTKRFVLALCFKKQTGRHRQSKAADALLMTSLSIKISTRPPRDFET